MNRLRTHPFLIFSALLVSFLLLAQSVETSTAQAETEQVQRISGRLEPGETHVYLIRELQAGDRISASMITTSGNLDPILGILDISSSLEAGFEEYTRETERIIAESEDVAREINELRDRFFLAWDDDGGEGYAAALDFIVPASGDYRIVASGSLSTVGRATSGNYELVVSRNTPNQDQLIGGFMLERVSTPGEHSPAVGEVTGALPAEQPLKTIQLEDIRAAETLYVYVEPTAGNLIPAVILRDFGGKPIQAANTGGEQSQAALEFTFPESAVGYSLEVQAMSGSDGELTEGDFRALLGLNDPMVLTGQATPTGRPVVREPIPVQVGIKMDRISAVDSQNENFTVLGSIRMDWTDPDLAFSPDSCQCSVKVYTEKEFDRFLAETQSRWPDFVFFNQSGNRWVQSRSAVIWPDGRARYGESFTTTFQADFDFRKFPFDTQEFPIFIDMLFPADTYVLADLPGYSAISSEHGEDEFIISGFTTSTTLETGRIADNPVSRFNFVFTAPRHLDYYVLQVFVPILLIILISWFTFFLKDYTRRIEAAAANILLFIAFSFSLSDNYPRLGYVTFLDAIMATTFAVNTLVLLYNVYMKRQENEGRVERVERIDNFFDWAYPLLYILMIGFVVFLFF